MISLLIYLLVVCLVIGLVWWAINQIPLPPPVRIVVIVVLVIIMILVLLSVLPGISTGARWPLLR